MSKLRPYQIAVVDEIDAAPPGDRPLVVAPTGSGKTIIASAAIKRRVERHQTVLVFAHRREIILQTRDKLAANGVFAGTIMAGTSPRLMQQAQAGSIQTLHARAIRGNTMDLPPADLLVIKVLAGRLKSPAKHRLTGTDTLPVRRGLLRPQNEKWPRVLLAGRRYIV